MTSLHKQIARTLLGPAEQAYHGEPLILHARMRRPNFSSTEGDASRTPQAYRVCGVFTNPYKDMRQGDMIVSSRQPVAKLMLEGLPWVPKTADIVERETGELFEVTTVEPDGVYSVELVLVQIGRQNPGSP